MCQLCVNPVPTCFNRASTVCQQCITYCVNFLICFQSKLTLSSRPSKMFPCSGKTPSRESPLHFRYNTLASNDNHTNMHTQTHTHAHTHKQKHAHTPGWQKLHGSTGGNRRKVWTRTKILGPNIRYFVAN